MNDDLDQLFKNLGLKRLREIIERELEGATRTQPSYSDFLVNCSGKNTITKRSAVWNIGSSRPASPRDGH